MIRISTIFIAICMVLIAASLGVALYALFGLNRVESGIVALTALTFLILYNAVSMRLRDRNDVGGQIADLSRGTADLARQVGEFGRRLAAIENRIANVNNNGADRNQAVLAEINDLGAIVKQLAISVAAHDDALTERPQPAAAAAAPSDDLEWTDTGTANLEETSAPAAAEKSVVPAPRPAAPSSATAAAAAPAPTAPVVKPAALAEPATPISPDIIPIIRKAIDNNQVEIFLQPIVTLPQRKVRFYEAMSRVRDDDNQLLSGGEFIAAAESAGLMGKIDSAVLFRCVQVLRRLMVRSKEVGVFCNLSATTLAEPESFAQCLDFLEANRALAPSFVIEFKQSMFRNLTPLQSESLAALAQRGFRFSMDNVIDLRIDARDLADRGVRYVKVPGPLLLDPKQSVSDIHPADLSDLLGRSGIDLIAERIEGERAVVDLLDYDVRFGQGFLFAEPKPLRPEAAPVPEAGKPASSSEAAKPAPSPAERMTGNAALVRRAARPS